MPPATHLDDDDDSLDEDPLLQDQDFDDAYDDEPDQDPCPFCGRPLYHDAAVCPGCGNFIDADQRTAPKPSWIVIATILAIVAMLASILIALLSFR